MRRRGGVIIAAALLAAAGCDDAKPSPTAGQISSLVLELTDPSPSSLGTPSQPIAAQQATFNVTALDEKGAVFGQDADVDVFISFGGVKTGASSMCGSDDSGVTPIATLHLTAGQAKNVTVMLPRAFGATSIWLDENKSHATGASPTIYFRNPLIADVQTPPDLTASNATFCSPFNGKFIIVDQPTGSGKLVVSSVFVNAFVITDTGASAFNNMYLYSFGKPPDYIVPGKVLRSFSGNVSKFVGFTELNFPLFDATDDATPLEPLPSPSPVSNALLTGGQAGEITLLGLAAGVVRYTGKLCNPDPPNPTNDPNVQKTQQSWLKYNQFTLDNDTTCSDFSNFAVELPAKTLGTFDPLMAVGHTVTVTGMLRNNSGQNPVLDPNGMPISCNAMLACATGTCIQGQCLKGAYNFWTIVPRTPEDICDPADPVLSSNCH